MKKNPKYLKPKPVAANNSSKAIKVVAIIAGVLLVVLIVLMLLLSRGCSQDNADIPTQPTVNDPVIETQDSNTEPPVEETEPEVTEPQMLPEMAELYAKNPDIVGWVKIEDTKLDYAVMHTPDDPEKYLYLNFNENFSVTGTPFLKHSCSMDPESDNLIIYGHHMKNGTAFKTLMSYTDEDFYEEHPLIQFTTLYEERTYEIVAVFYDKVYQKTDTCFKFYQFIDAEDEEDFNEAITYFKDKSLYDTGVTAEYGDSLITLVTCSYHVDDGRFVVVGRMVTDEAEETA